MIQLDGVKVDDNMNKDLIDIMQSSDVGSEETFSSIFWKQQLKAVKMKSSKGIRWHPAIIPYKFHTCDFCLSFNTCFIQMLCMNVL